MEKISTLTPNNAPAPKSNTSPNPFSRPNTPTTAPQKSNGGALFGRSNRQVFHWTIAPLSDTVVRFDLRGLGDPFYRILQTKINPNWGQLSEALKHLETNEKDREMLALQLNDKWEELGLRGAILLYPNEEGVRKAYTQPIQPTLPPPSEEPVDGEKEAEDDKPVSSEKSFKKAQCLRSIDTEFVINILARVRSHVIVANTSLALETRFLEQSYISDDPRLVKWAISTGCIEESWS